MKVKTFDFPSFSEWNKNKQEYEQSIGDYTCQIMVLAYGMDGKNKYRAVIGPSDNPINIYSKRSLIECFSCHVYSEKKLKKLYEKAVENLSKKWEDFILNTYMNM